MAECRLLNAPNETWFWAKLFEVEVGTNKNFCQLHKCKNVMNVTKVTGKVTTNL